jgi:opacity protein-like surface antigen
MFRSTVRLGAIVTLAAFGAAPVAAQSAQRFSVQLSGLGAKLSGNAFEDLGTGSGFEVQGRYNRNAFSIGGGFQQTWHSLVDVDDKVKLGGVFVEPRYVIPTKSNSAAPYASARVSILKESIAFDVPAGRVTGSASGATINGGGGVLVRLADRLNLDLGVTWGYTNFGKVDFKLDGTPITETNGIDAGSGSNFVFRVGVALGIGR